MSTATVSNEFVFKEAFNLFCGQELGRGSARHVFASTLDSKVVIKTESGGQSFQNVVEWEMWNAVRETPYAKWFAPCRFISPSGAVLVQDRTYPSPHYPPKMPVFLCDFKKVNYGILDGKFVCHDYGLMFAHNAGLCNRLRKADWRED